MKFINLEQGSPEWLEYRKLHANASEADIIMNCAPPWQTPRTWSELDLYKKGKLSISSNWFGDKMKSEGHRKEPIARQVAGEALGCHLIPAVVEEEGLSQVPLSASLDAFGTDMDGKTVKVEIKCPQSETSKVWADETIPEYYQWQMIHQDLVCPTDRSYFMVYLPPNKYRLIPVSSTPEQRQQLLEAWEKFWFSEIKPDWIEVDLKTEPAYLAAKLIFVQAELALEKAKKAVIKEASALGNKVRSRRIEVQTITRKGSVDYKKIPELKGVDLDQYRGKDSEYTTVRSI
jgi:putative phage-type endonuclease